MSIVVIFLIVNCAGIDIMGHPCRVLERGEVAWPPVSTGGYSKETPAELGNKGKGFSGAVIIK